MSSTGFRLALITLVVWCACFLNLISAEATTNLIPSPGFVGHAAGLPEGWHRDARKIPGVEPSRVYICQVAGYSDRLLAIEGGPDRNGEVWCRINNIRPHSDYLLKFIAYRPKFTNGVYLEVEIFGQRHLINQHFSYGRVQPIFLKVNSGMTGGTTRLRFQNPHSEVLAFGSPSLQRVGPETITQRQQDSVRLPNFFPVGIYAAKPEDLAEIRKAGFNAVQSYDTAPQTIRAMATISARLGLRYLPNFREDQANLSQELGGRPELLGFYIEDEPEGRSVPPKKLAALKKSLQEDHPGVLTAVAILRPQMVAAYREAADVFMIDPYPVPNMPMTWLSDSLEEAARYVSKERLWAVIQAFGGEKWATQGWPRRPSFREMRCLTYLAVVQGVHGIFYFSYPEVRVDSASWEGLKQIAAELHQLRTWLMAPEAPRTLQLEMTSAFKVDAEGRPAVHFCQKSCGAKNLLILVNVIDRPVSFYLHGFGRQVLWLTETFQKSKSVVRDGNIRGELGPHEVRIYSYHRED